MLVVVVGKANSGKSYFTNHHLFQTVPGLGGAAGTIRYVDGDVYAKKDFPVEVVRKLDLRLNVVIEIQDMRDIDPELRRKVDCYIFTSRVHTFPPEDELFNKRVKEVVDATFGDDGAANVASRHRVIYNRSKSTLVVHTDYDL